MLAWEAGSRPTRSGVYTWFILVIVNGAKLREAGCPSPRLDYSGQIATELQGQSLSLAVFCSIFSLSSWRQARTKLVGIPYRLYPNLLQVADASLRAWKLKLHHLLPPTKWNKSHDPSGLKQVLSVWMTVKRRNVGLRDITRVGTTGSIFTELSSWISCESWSWTHLGVESLVYLVEPREVKETWWAIDFEGVIIVIS